MYQFLILTRYCNEWCFPLQNEPINSHKIENGHKVGRVVNLFYVPDIICRMICNVYPVLPISEN